MKRASRINVRNSKSTGTPKTTDLAPEAGLRKGRRLLIGRIAPDYRGRSWMEQRTKPRKLQKRFYCPFDFVMGLGAVSPPARSEPLAAPTALLLRLDLPLYIRKPFSSSCCPTQKSTDRIAEAVQAESGIVTKVECGCFGPRRFRRQKSGPIYTAKANLHPGPLKGRLDSTGVAGDRIDIQLGKLTID